MVNTAESDTSLWFQRLLILIRFLMSTIILDHNQSWQWGMSDSSHLAIADISRILVSSSSSHLGKHEDVLWCAICVPPVSSPWPSQSSPELSLIFLSLSPSPWLLPELQPGHLSPGHCRGWESLFAFQSCPDTHLQSLLPITVSNLSQTRIWPWLPLSTSPPKNPSVTLLFTAGLYKKVSTRSCNLYWLWSWTVPVWILALSPVSRSKLPNLSALQWLHR